MERNRHHEAECQAISRREFLQRTSRSVVGTAAALALGPEVLAAEAPIERFRTLGRTKLKVTPVSFGGIQVTDRRIVDIAIDLGINLLHTAPGYTGGNSIRVFGEVFRDKKKRDKVVLAVKVHPAEVDNALKILNTDHIDIAIPDHGPISGAPFPNDELRAAYEACKKAGKIRFTGFATHQDQARTIAAATETGYFDVMLVAYNVTNREQLDPVIREAREKRKIGFMVMKAAGGLDRNNPDVWLGGLKSLLANRDVDTLTVGVGNIQHLQQNFSIVGRRQTRAEREALQRHLALTLPAACRLCGTCGGVCPKGIAVADIMRCRHYSDRGDLHLARETYHSLPAAQTAAACDGCGTCTRACPKRLNVAARVREAHAMLA